MTMGALCTTACARSLHDSLRALAILPNPYLRAQGGLFCCRPWYSALSPTTVPCTPYSTCCGANSRLTPELDTGAIDEKTRKAQSQIVQQMIPGRPALAWVMGDA